MYDYIIVGAGSAGCVLANRLSSDPDTRVLLIEAGPADRHPFIHMPAGIAHLVKNTRLNWSYDTAAETQLGGRCLWWPRGKVLGGSSAINAMCYIRGVPGDYDRWAAAGAEGWDWQNVLPLFRRSENNSRGSDALHGDQGPLHVSDLRHVNPLSHAFIEAAQQAGWAHNRDFNGPEQQGVGLYQVTQKDGARCSSAVAYLAPVRQRRNLTVITGALVERLHLEGSRVTGVHYRLAGRAHLAHAEAEVLLCAGAINSPQLLMLSGIGPAGELQRHGISVALDQPGIGANLQDHLDICTLYHTVPGVSYDRASELKVAIDYYLRGRRGAGTSNVAEAGGFVRSPLAADERCDIQFHFVPAMLDNHGRDRLPGDGYTLHACYLHPRSRGQIRLSSADPAAMPHIQANYLSDPEGMDMKVMVQAAKMSRDILRQPALERWRRAPIFPTSETLDDAGLEAFVRAKAESIYHPAGTCRMGNDARAVVDPQLRLNGLDGLRVVDASVMPTLVTGNTNAPTMMIAERAAELILGRIPAPVD